MAVAPSDAKSDQPSFPSKFELCTGLLDTGATVTGVSSRLVQKLGLRPMGRRPVLGVAGVKLHSYHLFRIGFEIPQPDGIPTFPYFAEPTIEGISWTDEASADVLIGMDVIGLCDLTITRAGSFRLILP
jgi:hypothetical protein